MKNGATTKFTIKDSVTGASIQVTGLLNSLEVAEELWVKSNNPQLVIDDDDNEVVFTVEADF